MILLPLHHKQSGLSVPYILEPHRTVPSILEREPNRIEVTNARARQCMVKTVISLTNKPYHTVQGVSMYGSRSKLSSTIRTESGPMMYGTVRFGMDSPLWTRLVTVLE